jgi:ATP-dependent DNA helicase DinG
VSVRARDVLGPGSALARVLPGYRARDGQLAMAEAVEAALDAERPLLVEAGTGTGKTLAYLVPAILSGKKVVVSTATRALQEQIYFKDLPIVADILAPHGIRFRAALMKGLSNYVCKRRMNESLASGSADGALFRLRRWAAESEFGDRSELADLAEDDPAWAAIGSSTETRIGAECTYFDECFVTRMKRDAEDADLIVVNHHLFCADLVLRRAQRERASAIPAYDAVIFDEAHQLEDVATTFFGSTISAARVDALARDARRTLGDENAILQRPIAEQLTEAGRSFFYELGRTFRGETRRAIRRDDETPELEGARSKLEAALAAIAHDAQTKPGPAAEQIARRALELAAVLSGNEKKDEIAWIEIRASGAVMGRSPVFLGDVLAESLFARVGAVVCTSATLATPAAPVDASEDAEEKNERSFDFLRERLGVPRVARALAIPSPFDFASRAGLYVPRDLPDPGDPRFDDAAAARALELVELTGGGAFVLCTSNRAMRALHGRLSRQRGSWGPLLLQGDRPKSLLLSQFRAAKHAVLVATMSFWEGVDVPGEALRLVILDKIPFAVPSDPVVAARCEEVERRGMNAFYNYSVPAAALALKQGFGRLLRSETDAGLVALLDRRALTKAYGRALLRTLPPARQLRTLDETRNFWVHIRSEMIPPAP